MESASNFKLANATALLTSSCLVEQLLHNVLRLALFLASFIRHHGILNRNLPEIEHLHSSAADTCDFFQQENRKLWGTLIIQSPADIVHAARTIAGVRPQSLGRPAQPHDFLGNLQRRMVTAATSRIWRGEREEEKEE